MGYAVQRHLYRGISTETRRDGTPLPCVDIGEAPTGRMTIREAFQGAKELAGWNGELARG